jgi:lon-related putative ATP-dependent protease
MVEVLPPEMFRNTYDPAKVTCESTAELNPLDEIIGQERALRALRFGLEIKENGFNVYVSGIPGTGRMSAVRGFLSELAKAKPRASDWIYVNNFGNQYEPNAIRLPAGTGKQFRADMEDFIDEARKALPRAFESEDYARKREAAVSALDEKKAALVTHMNTTAQEQGFVIQMSPAGLLIIPVVNGQPVPEEQFMSLPEEVREEIARKREALGIDLRNTLRQLREIDLSGAEAVDGLNREVALYAIGPPVTEISEKYKDVPEILAYIESVKKDIIENLELFLGGPQPPQVPPQFQAMFQKDLPFRKYQVNVVVDNSSSTGAPVIHEQNPNFPNLFGKIEKEVQFGFITTDFTMIQPGSVHKANGGYLVLMVEDLFRNPLSWDALKTALKTGKAAIEEPGERMGFITAKSIRPEPMPLDAKVVLVGTPPIYQILYTMDPEFKDLFKVKADFDTVMDRNEENALKYEAFICTLCSKSGLLHLDRGAVAKVMEFASRLAEDQQKFSTRFSGIGDLIREANFYAARDGSKVITAEHMTKAIEEKIYRSSLIQEKIREYIARGIFLIDTEGAKAGQVNGLSVTGSGDYAFGMPSRVTATIGVGREGIVDIEREAAMGGPIHTKGVLILHGYLAEKFARDKPLSISARLVFEQSYSGVEGDSASSTELYALLSALSGLPIRQDLAVTGSVNQKGEVQAIGGVNEKLEGFFEVCRAKGLTGKQGAMIPASNVQNLMLKEEMVEAGKAGKFTIYPVKTIDEGIEVLTGVPAGKRKKDGTYPERTVNHLVDKKLREMAETYRAFQPGGR